MAKLDTSVPLDVDVIARGFGDVLGGRATPPANPVEGQIYDFSPAARPVIWDTDWWTDCDDVAEARVLAWAAKQGLIDIRAIGLNTNQVYSPASLDALFQNDGLSGLPLCRPKTSHVPDGSPAFQLTLAINYPNRGLLNANLPDAVTEYRRQLAAAVRPIEFIEAGYLNNLHELLLSPGDSISPLTGAQLVAAKCSHLWCMGGVYPTGTENNFARTAQAVAAAVYVCANWPTPITFLGYEVGATVVAGAYLQPSQPTDIVANAFHLNGSDGGRSSWGPMLTLLACYGDLTAAGYTSVQGNNVVTPGSGANTFTPGAGNHRYVVKAKADGWYAEQLNPLFLQSTQPAAPRARKIYKDGVWQNLSMADRAIGGAAAAKPTDVTATVDVENLAFQLHASDCAEVGDGGSIPIIRNRVGLKGFRIPAINAGMPVYRANIGGKTAIQVAANNYLTSPAFRQPLYRTVYAKVRWATLPAGNQTILAADPTATGGTRIFHAKATATGAAETAVFTQTGGGQTDDSATSLLVANTWHTLVFRMDATTFEALVDGVGNGATARTSPPCVNTTQLSLFSRSPTASIEQFVGYLHELRDYNSRHSDAQIAAVIADMD